LTAALQHYWFYLGKVLLPLSRTVVYPEGSPHFSNILVAAGTITSISALVWWQRRTRPAIWTGWLWFLIVLLPVIGLVRVGYAPVADRYTYLPSIGLSLALSWTLAEVAHGSLARISLCSLLALAMVAGCAAATVADIGRWRDTGALFEAATRVAPHKIAFNNLAHFRIKQQQFAEAADACTRAIELDPTYASSFGNRALALARLGRYEAARADYDQAVQLGARPLLLQTTTGNDDHSPDDAWFAFAAALRLSPTTAKAFLDRALYRFRSGDDHGALADFGKVLELSPGETMALTGRGNTFVRLKQWDLALADLARVVELTPTDPSAYQNRAVIYFQLGRIDDAWADINKCLRHGGSPPSSFIQALSDSATGRPDEFPQTRP
jgi:tetratricopeptide (TPR) repeat protein